MFKLPSKATVILGLITGALEIVNRVVLAPWLPAVSSVITVLLVLAAGIVGPIVGPQFRAALHLPPWAAGLVSYILAAAALLITLHVNSPLDSVLSTLLVVAAGLGFAPSPNVAKPSKPTVAWAASPDDSHSFGWWVWQIVRIPFVLPIIVVDVIKLLFSPIANTQ